MTGRLFWPLKNYLETVIEDGLAISNQTGGTTVESYALIIARMLSTATFLRSYGLPGNINKSYIVFSKLSGGATKSIEAIEFLPRYIFKKFRSNWKGFIIAQDPKYSHFNNIIMIPTDSLWNPSMWWALYHEIAHVMLGNNEWLSEDVDVIRNFLSGRQKQFRRSSHNLLEEIAAEVIGFELGMFDDIELFLELLWNHLYSIDALLDVKADYHLYLIRSFSVCLFHRVYRLRMNKKQSKIFDDDILYQEFLNHIEHVEAILQANASNLCPIVKDKKFFAATNTTFFKDLLPVLEYLNNKLRELEKGTNTTVRPPKKFLTSSSTNKALDMIFSGQIYWDRVASPQALLYSIFKRRSELNFASNIAAVITFWNLSRKMEGRS